MFHGSVEFFVWDNWDDPPVVPLASHDNRWFQCCCVAWGTTVLLKCERTLARNDIQGNPTSPETRLPSAGEGYNPKSYYFLLEIVFVVGQNM